MTVAFDKNSILLYFSGGNEAVLCVYQPFLHTQMDRMNDNIDVDGPILMCMRKPTVNAQLISAYVFASWIV